MKKEFTVEQLVTIRDIISEQCEKCISNGMRDIAEEYLDIINVVQENTGYDEYDNLDDFYLNESGTFSYVEKKELDELEEVAVDEMIAFAKSDETEPSENMKMIINKYLEDCFANSGNTYKDTVDRRIIAINKLIILCIYSEKMPLQLHFVQRHSAQQVISVSLHTSV